VISDTFRAGISIVRGPKSIRLIKTSTYGNGFQLSQALGDLLHVLLRGDGLQVGVHNPPKMKVCIKLSGIESKHLVYTSDNDDNLAVLLNKTIKAKLITYISMDPITYHLPPARGWKVLVADH